MVAERDSEAFSEELEDFLHCYQQISDDEEYEFPLYEDDQTENESAYPSSYTEEEDEEEIMFFFLSSGGHF